MRLLIVRHAPAGDKETFAKTGRPDAERPLTGSGRQKMREAARGLRELLFGLDWIATSPLKRARQTAAVLAKIYGARVIELVELEPGAAPASLEKRLASMGETVAVVGHEPHLSALTGYYLGGKAAPLKKGGACLLEFGAAPKKGGAALVWSVPPKALRALSRRS
jgi:phosphohistidine phosphatase